MDDDDDIEEERCAGRREQLLALDADFALLNSNDAWGCIFHGVERRHA